MHRLCLETMPLDQSLRLGPRLARMNGTALENVSIQVTRQSHVNV